MRAIVAAALFWAGPALADTGCPEVSNGVSILNVQVLNPPMPVAFAGLDLETHFLTVTYFDQSSRMFVAVPTGVVTNGNIQYVTLTQYTQAIMQERSVCPYETEDFHPLLVN